MKLLYIANVRIPTEKAHGIQIAKMCEAFSKNGADIELVVPTRRNASMGEADVFSYYDIDRSFNFKKIYSPDPMFLHVFPRGMYIKVQTLLFISSLFVYLLFKKGKKDLIFYTRDEALLPFLQLFSARTIWEAHRLPVHVAWYVRYWKKCKGIVAITEKLKYELVRSGVPDTNVLVAADGVDIDTFHILDSKASVRASLDLPIERRVVLYAGHLYDWKGAHVLADAVPLLNKEILFIFVGGTETDIQRFKETYSSAGNILFVGSVKPGFVPRYLAAADVVILPSSSRYPISSKYTSPLKMFEYMASRRPIVASRLPSLEEVLNDENSVLVEPDSPRSLAQGIERVLYDAALGERLVKQAYSDVQRHSWDLRARSISTFIDR